jgi:ribonuclease BN (tRNA processing enzyme)
VVSVRYIGTGEAFDHRLPNTSMVFDGGHRILLDCGYSVPHALWSHSTDPNWLDAVYISHFHADHCFGLPALLARMGEDGRQRELLLLGGPGSAEAAARVLETGYPRILEKLPYPLIRREVDTHNGLTIGPIQIRTARSNHSVPNHSIRLQEGEVSVCYSGDGGPNPETEALFSGASLLIHEAYYDDWHDKQSHASVPQVLALAERAGVQRLHLIHLRRTAPIPQGVEVPRPGDVVVL